MGNLGKNNIGYVNRVGEKHSTLKEEVVLITECTNAHNCTIQFEDGTIVKGRKYNDIKNGNIRNPNTPSVYGMGYMGVGEYSSSYHVIAYDYWHSMLERCYSEISLEKCPTYKKVTVCGEWKCFQNFAEWLYSSFNKDYMEGWHLDKDILSKGNKIYSPETCDFVPIEINSLFTKSDSKRGNCVVGVHLNKHGSYVAQIKKTVVEYLGSFSTELEAFQAYKTAKEDYIKEVAESWKDKIDPKVYNAMYNYIVEITD